MDDFLAYNMDFWGGTLGNSSKFLLDNEHDQEFIADKNIFFQLILELSYALDDFNRNAGCSQDMQRYGQYSTSDTFKKLASDYCKTYIN